MAMNLRRMHDPADLSAHRGLMLNADFGFTSRPCDLRESWKRDVAAWKALSASADRLRLAIGTASGLGIAGLVVAIAVALW